MNSEDRLRELINAWCSGELDEPSHSELEECLRRSPDARRLFLEYRATESALRRSAFVPDLAAAPLPRPWQNYAVASLAAAFVALLAWGLLSRGEDPESGVSGEWQVEFDQVTFTATGP